MTDKRCARHKYRSNRTRMLQFMSTLHDCQLVEQTAASNNNDFWYAYFDWVYGYPPISNDDPRWTEMLHEHGSMRAFRVIRRAIRMKRVQEHTRKLVAA